MFRLLSVVLTLGALVATFAFANTFNINGNTGQAGNQDISSGEAFVAACNGNVEVDLVGNGYNAGVGDFVLSHVLINADPGCEGDTVTVQLTTGSTGGNPDGSALGTAGSTTLLALGDASVDFIGQNIKVADITDVHVMVDSGDNTAP